MKENLVLIGNGMAGVRTLEEMLKSSTGSACVVDRRGKYEGMVEIGHLTEVIRTLRAAVPDAAILIIGPLDQARWPLGKNPTPARAGLPAQLLDLATGADSVGPATQRSVAGS